jgi:murein DD-endopeptidase MepM/ murein hydrolase activator NlpD
MWPLRTGSVSSFYGARDGKFHDGLDIRASSGTPIYAARDGVVIYSGRGIRGYGNVVIIRHDSALATIYAHNRRNLARRGQTIRQGALIAYVGATGHATGPHLHFEVRRNEMPQDPIYFLPLAGSGARVAQASTHPTKTRR